MVCVTLRPRKVEIVVQNLYLDPQKYVKVIAFRAIISDFLLLFYILVGSRYRGFHKSELPKQTHTCITVLIYIYIYIIYRHYDANYGDILLLTFWGSRECFFPSEGRFQSPNFDFCRRLGRGINFKQAAA